MLTVNFNGTICKVSFAHYQKGNIAIQLLDSEDGLPVTTATSNFDELNPDEVAIKNYSENVGMYTTLLEADIIHPYHSTISSTYVTFPVCKLTNKALKYI